MLAWGINDFGQLGNGSTFYETQPTQVAGLEDVRIADINAGGWHSLALTTDGGAPALCTLVVSKSWANDMALPTPFGECNCERGQSMHG